MKKLLLILLLFSVPTVAKDKVLGQSYIDLGFSISDIIVTKYHQGNILNIGGQVSFGICWDYSTHLFFLEIFKPSLYIAWDLAHISAKTPWGFGSNIKFFEMGFGKKENKYSYNIYLFGIGVFADVLFFNSDRLSGSVLGVAWTLPLGFKITWNSMFVSLEHQLVGEPLSAATLTAIDQPLQPISYNITFTIGKRFDIIGSRVSGLK